MRWRVGFIAAAALFGGIAPAIAQIAPGSVLAPAQALPTPVLQPAGPAIGSGDLTGYTLGPGDRVRVIVFNEPSLSGEYGINDDGQLIVSLVGPVKVNGKTPLEAGEMLRAALAGGYLNDPKVSIELLTYRPFYILGEVGRPGAYPYTNNLTITQAIASAGGYSYRANRRTVFLKRKGVPEIKVKVRTDDQVVGPGDVIRVGERYF